MVRTSRHRVPMPVLAVLLALALLAGACAGVASPRGDPAIRGAISSVSFRPGGSTLATILVEGRVEPDTQYDKAAVAVTRSTRIRRADGASVPVDALGAGMQVEVWFTGPVAESYPVQATADTIVVLAGG